MRIVIDTMGGDHAPGAPVEGAVLYHKETGGSDEIILVGDEDATRKALSTFGYSSGKIPANFKIVHATEVIDMSDAPAAAVRKKKDSSMVKGIRLQKNGEADAFVSAGSTGAQMAASLLVLGRVKGVLRPALGAFLPHQNGVTLLIDVGANADCKPPHLMQFGVMGAIFMEYIYGLEKIRIGLLNIGEEKSKGNELMIATHELMAENMPRFVGNVEGREVLDGSADVVVTDGFTGNVVLKFAEGIAGAFATTLKKSIKKNPLAMFGALFMRSSFNALRKSYDYEEYGGVPLLGIDGISIICHGSSSSKAIKNAIHVARRMSEKDVNKHIEEEISARGSKWDEKQLLQA